MEETEDFSLLRYEEIQGNLARLKKQLKIAESTLQKWIAEENHWQVKFQMCRDLKQKPNIEKGIAQIQFQQIAPVKAEIAQIHKLISGYEFALKTLDKKGGVPQREKLKNEMDVIIRETHQLVENWNTVVKEMQQIFLAFQAIKEAERAFKLSFEGELAFLTCMTKEFRQTLELPFFHITAQGLTLKKPDKEKLLSDFTTLINEVERWTAKWNEKISELAQILVNLRDLDQQHFNLNLAISNNGQSMFIADFKKLRKNLADHFVLPRDPERTEAPVHGLLFPKEFLKI